MSILKAILHHYNSTSKSYDTLHPETESAQITDWHKAVVNSLASTTLPAVVSALTTDSVMGKLMKLLLNASGVKYLIDTNGYICFGSFFGGLIIQWGNNIEVTSSGYSVSFEYPIVFPTKVLAVVPFDVNSNWSDVAIPSVHAAWYPNDGSDGNDLRWARIGFSVSNTTFGDYRFVAIGK